MSLKKILLSASLIPILMFGNPSKSKAGEKFHLNFTIQPPINSVVKIENEIERIKKGVYKICTIAKYDGKTENLGCIYKKAIDTTNSTSLYHKPQKHYNWIKPDKYDNWQCAYELTYDGKEPDGFKLYVDTDGDGKPDYQYEYYLGNYGGFFNGASFTFYRSESGYPVNYGYYHNLKKATNICLQPAVLEVIGKGGYLDEPISNFKVDKLEADVDYVKVRLLTHY